jgi:small subunit ribosomal protein S20
MANIKSQKKRIEIAETRRVAHASFKSKMRHQVKKVDIAVAAGDIKVAEAELPEAISLIDKSVKMGIQHINTAGRQKAHLMKEVENLKKNPKKEVSVAAKKAEIKEEKKEEKAAAAEGKAEAK